MSTTRANTSRKGTTDTEPEPDAATTAPAGQPEPDPPADEAQTTRSTGPDVEAQRAIVAELTTALDALGTRIEAAVTGPLDLSEVHDRFDVLAQQLADVATFAAPQRSGPPVVYGKVLQLMREVFELGKGGKAAAEMGGYAFRKVDDAIDAVGAAIRSIGLVVRSEVVEVTSGKRMVGGKGGPREGVGCRVTMRYVFIAPEDESEHAIEGVGEGADAGDKATSKAASMALKYALLQGLMIPVEGVHVDTESEDTRTEPAGRDDRRDDRRGGGRDERERGRERSRDDRRDERPRDDERGRERGRERPASEHHRMAGDREAPPELRAEATLRLAYDGRSALQIDELLQWAQGNGLADQDVRWHDETATLRQHLIGAIRVTRSADA